MGDIVLVRIGTETDGDPARGCPHMAQWWPLYTQLLKLKLGITLEIIQAAGSYSKSGATHVEGTAIDWRTWRFRDSVVDDAVELAREGGAPATWMRSKRRFGQTFDDHVHLAIDCPCASGADYQITAVKAGFNGLGYRGRGGKDYHARPATWRNWSTGMAWMRAEIARLTPKPPAASAGATSDTDLERWLDAMDTNQLRQIIREESQKGADAALWQPAIAGRTSEWGASLRDSAARAANRAGSNATALARVESRLAALAAKEGIAVDEAQIAKDIAALIAPQVRDAVLDAATDGGTPEAIADAVVAKLGTALTQD